MADTTLAEPVLATSLEDTLSRLMAFEPSTFPVISLYLDAQADKTGRDQFDAFVRKELASRGKTYAPGTPEKASFEADAARIIQWLAENVEASANGIAIFACEAGGLWETVQLNAPVGENRLYIYNQPHLYHLARLDDEYPKYAALLTDANSARIYVFGLGQTLETEQVKGKKVNRVKVGGWSQARYQRRVDNAHANHAKETVEALDRLVKQEGVKHIVVTGDSQITSLLLEQMSKELSEKVVDVLKLDIKSTERDIFDATLEAMRRVDAATDAEKVDRLMAEYRKGGLACLGQQETLEALANGQVDELLICTCLESQHLEAEPVEAVLAPELPDAEGNTETDEPRPVLIADLLVTKAKQIDASVTFIQDAKLLWDAGGVGAMLRWRN